MNKHKVGLTLGAFLGLMHLVWSVLVALGLAQGYLDFVLMLHSLSDPYTVAPFNLVRSVMLIVLVSVVGYVVGFVFAMVFNKLHK